MSKKSKASSNNKKATSKKVVKKATPKKAVKKVAKVAAKKAVVKKPLTKKPVAKVVASKAKKVVKPVKKSVAKKPIAKVASKKITAKKVAAKKVVAKPAKKAIKKPVAKVAAKKAIKKPVVKVAVKAKNTKVVAKKVVAPKKVVKAVKVEIPVKVAKPAKPEKVKVEKVVAPKKVATPKVKPVVKKQITAPTTFRANELAVPAKQSKEPAGKFEMEFVIRASEDMVFEFISTESGLSEWFCDDVTVRNGIFTFEWDGQTQQAQLIKEQPPIFIRYQWLDKNDGSYFEFRTQKDELTNDISLIVTDFASDKNEEESARLLWHSQVDKLLHVLGSFF